MNDGNPLPSLSNVGLEYHWKTTCLPDKTPNLLHRFGTFSRHPTKTSDPNPLVTCFERGKQT